MGQDYQESVLVSAGTCLLEKAYGQERPGDFRGAACCFDSSQLKELPLNQALVESRVAGGGVPLKILGVINWGKLSPPYLCVVPSPPGLSRCCRDVSRTVWK